MIYRKRRTLPTRKRRYVRRKPTRMTRYKQPRRLFTQFPRSRTFKLRYSDMWLENLAAGSMALPTNYTTYYQTSLYDPYGPIGGHQPLGFDQWSTIFQRYRVHGVAYKFVFSTTYDFNVTCAVRPDVLTTLPSLKIADWIEARGTQYRTFSKNTPPGIINGYVSVAKMFGVKHSTVMTDDEYSAGIAANPANMVKLHLGLWNVNASAVNLYVQVTLTFYCTMYDNQTPAAS